MRYAICLLAFGAMVSSATADDFVEMGVGVATCARFNQEYAKNPALAENIFFSWAQGYISGMNRAMLANRVPYRNMDSIALDRQRSGLRQYCQKNPNVLYLTAVVALHKAMTPSTAGRTGANTGTGAGPRP